MADPAQRGRTDADVGRPGSRKAGASTGGEAGHRPGRVLDPLARVLGAVDLARVAPTLAPETLHAIVRHRGLDGCQDLIAFTTPAQLTSLFDLELWRNAEPGQDEHFDAARFGEWVDALVEAGEATAARIVAALEPRLVIAGLSRHIRVLDPGALAPVASEDDERADDRRGGGLTSDMGGYVVAARREDAWDAIVALLIALESGHPDSFHTFMRGCRRLSDSTPEADGLDDLLGAPGQLLHDLAIGRQERRSALGYTTPAESRAFLEMARADPAHRASARANAIADACLRRGSERSRGPVPASADERTSAGDHQAAGPAPATTAGIPWNGEEPADLPADRGADIEGARHAIVDLLAQAGMVPERPRALLAGDDARQPRLAHIRPLMEHVREHDGAAYLARGQELAFLANTLVAGCSVLSRPFTPPEATDAAVGVCNLGLEYWPARWPRPPGLASAADGHDEASPSGQAPLPLKGQGAGIAFLADHDLVTAFEVGWAVLHEEVSLFVAERLLETVSELTHVPHDLGQGLETLRRELARHSRAGAPWRARDALDVLASLDVAAWASLLGLLGECPVVPAALPAILERRTGAISATAFEFISTRAQFEPIRAFMRQLPTLLRG